MISIESVFNYVGRIFDTGLHQARLESVSNAVVAILEAEKLSIALIDRALSEVRGDPWQKRGQTD